MFVPWFPYGNYFYPVLIADPLVKTVTACSMGFDSSIVSVYVCGSDLPIWEDLILDFALAKIGVLWTLLFYNIIGNQFPYFSPWCCFLLQLVRRLICEIMRNQFLVMFCNIFIFIRYVRRFKGMMFYLIQFSKTILQKSSSVKSILKALYQ